MAAADAENDRPVLPPAAVVRDDAGVDGVAPLKKSVPVPSTDLRAALRTIDNEIGGLLKGSEEEDRNVDGIGRDENNNGDGSGGSQEGGEGTATAADQANVAAKVAAARSFKSNLVKIARPVDDAEHEERLREIREDLMLDRSLRQQQQQLQNDDGGEALNVIGDDEEDSDLSSEEDETDEEEEEEEDEDEMIDQDALARVRALREEVRATAQRVASKRDDVTRRAVDLVGKEVDGMRKVHGGVAADDDKDSSRKLQQDNEDGDEAIPEEDAARLQSMRAALKSLTESVADVDSTLPDKIESLRSTVDTVSLALERSRRRRAEGDEKVLSQTEIAIYSKPEAEGGGGEDGGAEGVRAAEEVARVRAMEPGERFAAFMSRTTA